MEKNEKNTTTNSIVGNKLSKKNTSQKIKQLTTMAVMAAIGVVIATLVHFPIMPGAEFLMYDPDDIPVILTALLYGPGSGAMVAFVICFFEFLTHNESGFWGVFMHLVGSTAFSITVGILAKKTKIKTIYAIILGAVSNLIVMIIMNLIITPIFMGVPLKTVQAMLIPAIIPFNIIKLSINCALIYIVYTFLSKKTKLFAQ